MRQGLSRRSFATALALIHLTPPVAAQDRSTIRGGVSTRQAHTPGTFRNLRFEFQLWDAQGGGPRLWGFEAFRAVEGAPATARFGRARGYLQSVTVETSGGRSRTVPREGFADTGVLVTAVGRSVGEDGVTVAYEITISELSGLSTVQALDGMTVELPSVPSRRFGSTVSLRGGAEHRVEISGGAQPSWLVIRALPAD